MDRLFFAMGSIAGLLGVAAGAFGAHGLQSRLDARAMEIFQTAARYHLFHAIALLAAAWAVTRWPGGASRFAGWSFLAGLVLFSGSLYALSLGAPRGVGAITPFGGLAFMLGWGALAAAALTAK